MRTRGFTLIELLVVITIILVLVGLLAPALAAAWELAQELTCQVNIRAIVQASMTYAAAHDLKMPYPNWIGNPGSPGWSEPVPEGGWCYAVPASNSGTGASVTPPVGWSYPGTYTPEMASTGQLYPYLGNLDAYRCPLDPVDELPNWQRGTSHELSSYRFNGAIIGFMSGSDSKEEWEVVKKTEFRSEDDIFVWEAAPDGNWRLTDLSSAPQEDFWGGLGMSIAPTAHRTGAYVGSVGGHVEWLDWDEAYDIANGAKPNRFWCYPRSPEGGRDRI